MALSPEQINAIYQLSQVEKWSHRKIARHLALSRKVVKKYIQRPALVHSPRNRISCLQPYYPQIQQWLLQDPTFSGVRILEQLRPLGYSGGHSILHQYLSAIRPKLKPQAFVRIEVPAGVMAQMDWAECGSIQYDGFPRRLYLFAIQESHSRLLYAEFTHSMNLPTLCRCHWHAFHLWGGVTREVLFDNMKTVVAQRHGRIIAFHLPFLDFARQMGFIPKACQPAAPWQKGKIERVIGYLQQNFLPGRAPFASLAEANQALRQWLPEVANQRIHRETQQKPCQRFRPDALLPLPSAAPDYRDIANPRVGKDLRLHFDGNRYCLPPRYVGSRLLVKADSCAVSIYDQQKEIVSYPRLWTRHATLGAERFEKELLQHRPRALASSKTQRLIQALGPSTVPYLQALANQGFVLDRQVSQLLELIRRYDPEPVRLALEKALHFQAWGVEYITNILLQQAHPRCDQPPVILQNQQLALLTPDPISLLEYDALLLQETESDL